MTNPNPGRLDSWKQIAAYLDKSERTVRRWEQTEGLPVHKHQHQLRGSVWAFQSELDEWLDKRRVGPKASAEPLEQPPLPTSLRWWYIGTATAITLLILGLGLFWRLRDPAGVLYLGEPEPLTALPGSEYGTAFSPDARQVVFFWDPENHQHPGLYRKQIGADDVVPLVTTADGEREFYYNPAWSPDGKTIAFLNRAADGSAWLMVVSPAGGAARRVVRLTRPGVIYYANHQHLSWSLDSSRILAPMADGDERRGIFWVNVSTGEAQQIVRSGAALDWAPLLAPDGKSFVYMRREGPPQAGIEEVVRQPLTNDGRAAGSGESIRKAPSMASGLAWVPGGRELMFCNAETTLHGPFANRLYRMEARAGAKAIPTTITDCSTVTVSRPGPDGTSLLVYGKGGRANWRSKLLQASRDAIGEATELLPSSRHDSMPRFSPDGSRLAFVSTRSGRLELWVSRADGSEARRLTDNSQIRSAPNWSPDGTRLLYAAAPASEPAGVMVLSVTGGTPVRVPLAEAAPGDPAWSADGKSIYYTTENRLWRGSLDGRERKLLHEGGAHLFVAESPDGQSVYYTRPGQRFLLCRLSRDGSAEEVLAENLFTSSFALTSHAITAFQWANGGVVLVEIPLLGGERKILGTLKTTYTTLQVRMGLTVSEQSGTLVWAASEGQDWDLELIRKFR